MSHPTSNQLQAYLDRDLDAPDRAAVAAHVGACPQCASELVRFERVFGSLASVAIVDPGFAFTDHVLDRVVPSRVWRRHVAVAGWTYSAATAVTTFAFIGWITRPDTPLWLRWLVAAAGERVLQTLLFAVNAASVAALQVREGWGVVEALGTWIRPLARAITTVTAQPYVGAPLVCALVLTLLVLWWMHASPQRTAQRIRAHVFPGV